MAIVNKIRVYDSLGNSTQRDIGVKSENISFEQSWNIADGLTIEDNKLKVDFNDPRFKTSDDSETIIPLSAGNGIVIDDENQINLNFAQNGEKVALRPISADDSRLEDKREPISHANRDSIYGIGTNSLYGHVRVQNDIGSNSSFDDGEVPSANIVARLLKRIEDLERNSLNINKLYPIGSIYITYNNTNPTNFIGGSWSLIQSDYIKAATTSTNNTTNRIGGSNSTSITINENNLPPRTVLSLMNRTGKDVALSSAGWNTEVTIKNNAWGTSTLFDFADNRIKMISQSDVRKPISINVEPKYIKLYFWRRVS